MLLCKSFYFLWTIQSKLNYYIRKQLLDLFFLAPEKWIAA
uniref:Uncharacterized protein n=1 Tax=Leptospira santarosai serovar Arenal str. MAVJ 401 TaxID=1049976 RepID=M6JHW7_9LEPT|nr:hypothetical protein LEP1GSC063_3935 [Leptospira santarosai serovar Arenal str. MAVJ 401]